jgi:hypothetical protein
MAAGTINPGGNIKFLLGTQDSLENYIVGKNGAIAENGAFYLTNDTHRLYVGTSDGKAVPVNEGVITVQDVGNLPTTNVHAGEFYYATNQNILCVYAGKSAGWVQINSNTDTYLVSGDTSITLANNVATLTQSFIQNDNQTAFTDTIEIEVADGIKMAVNGDRISLTGVLNKQFNVSADKDVATVELEDTFGGKVPFKIQAKTGSNIKVGKGAGSNEVEIDVNDMYNTGVSITQYNAAPTADGGDGKSGFSINVHDGKGMVSGDFNPAIKVGKEKSQIITFSNGTADLPVYTQAEIDDIKLALNAMTYRGLVGKDKTTTQEAWSTVYKSTTVAIGDTYLFAEDTNYTPSGASQSVLVTKGTLVIARGTEGTNGYITANTLQWDFVESTVDTDTKYKFTSAPTIQGTAGYVELTGVINGQLKPGERITFVDGTAIRANVVTDANNNATVSFIHVDVACTPTEGEILQDKAVFSVNDGTALGEKQITVLESVTVNNQGHVTGFKKNTITLRDTNATVADLGTRVNTVDTVANTSSTATLNNFITLLDGAGNMMTEKTGAWKFTSSSLTFKKDATDEKALSVDLVWGTF